MPRQLCSQHVMKKTLVSDARAASGADQFKHRAKVVLHPEVLRVLNALPRHRPITVTALQRLLLLLGFCSCSCRDQLRAGLVVHSSSRGGCAGPGVLQVKSVGKEGNKTQNAWWHLLCILPPREQQGLMASPVHPSSQRAAGPAGAAWAGGMSLPWQGSGWLQLPPLWILWIKLFASLKGRAGLFLFSGEPLFYSLFYSILLLCDPALKVSIFPKRNRPSIKTPLKNVWLPKLSLCECK